MKYLAIFFLLFSSSHDLAACRCLPNSLDAEIEWASSIFQGKVVKASPEADGVLYHFQVEKNWKGTFEKVKKIKTGFGGGDCGFPFEVNASYVVFANDGATNRCHQNSLLNQNYDALKLDYFFSKDLKDHSFVDDNPQLNAYEADYLNKQFASKNLDFDFSGKVLAFTSKKRLISKSSWYLSNWDHNQPVVQLIRLSETERQATGYDAILVSWNKMNISKRQRKKLLKQLTQKGL